MYYALLTLTEGIINQWRFSSSFKTWSGTEAPCQCEPSVQPILWLLHLDGTKKIEVKDNLRMLRVVWCCYLYCSLKTAFLFYHMHNIYSLLTSSLLYLPYYLYSVLLSFKYFSFLSLSANCELEPLLGTNYIAVNNTDTVSPNKD